MKEDNFNFEIPKEFNLSKDCIERWKNHKKISKKIAIFEVNNNCEVKKINYSQMSKRISEYAKYLINQNIEKGDRVLIRLDNSINFIISFLAIVRIGAIAIPSSILLKPNELDFIINNSQPKAVITESLISFFKKKGMTLLSLKCTKADSPINSDILTLSDDPCYITYTSGTTGKPKGVLHAHRSILGREPSTRYWLNLKKNDVVFNPGKLNWTYTLGAGCLDCLRFGSSVVIYSGQHNVQNYIKIIERLKVTMFLSVPGVYRQMLREIEANKKNIKKLNSVNKYLSAGEHLKKEIILSWKDKTNKFIYEGLGMSEISYFISNRPNKKLKPGSCGKIQPGHFGYLVDKNYKKVKNYQGELAIKRDDPGLMLAYWNDKPSTNKKFKKNLFLTGDIFEIDKEGYLWFISRKDELINVSGFRVSPKEVEDVVDSLEEVKESALCIKRIDNLKEITVLKVNLNVKASKRILKKINTKIDNNLADYKKPKELVLVNKIAKTANGKIIRLIKS